MSSLPTYLAVIAVIVATLVWKAKNGSLRPPSPPGRWLIGNLLDMPRTTDTKKLAAWKEQHGQWKQWYFCRILIFRCLFRRVNIPDCVWAICSCSAYCWGYKRTLGQTCQDLLSSSSHCYGRGTVWAWQGECFYYLCQPCQTRSILIHRQRLSSFSIITTGIAQFVNWLSKSWIPKRPRSIRRYSWIVSNWCFSECWRIPRISKNNLVCMYSFLFSSDMLCNIYSLIVLSVEWS